MRLCFVLPLLAVSLATLGCKSSGQVKLSAGGESTGVDADAEASLDGSGDAASDGGGGQPSKPAIAQSFPAGPPVATLPTFEVLADGRSLVTVQVSGDTTVTEQKAEGRLVYALKGVQVPSKVNRLAMPTQNFETRVAQVQLEQTPDGANLLIDLREPAGDVRHEVSPLEGGTMLAVTIPKTERYAAAPPPSQQPEKRPSAGGASEPSDTDPSDEPSDGEASDEERVDEEEEIAKSTAGKSGRSRRGAGDDARFRGAIAGIGGMLVIPETERFLGTLGLQGEIGVQIDDLTGIVFIPGVGYVVGSESGAYAAAAILVDFTFDDFFTFGLGPQALGFAAGSAGASSVSVSGGAMLGGLARFAFHPVVGYGEDESRRKALTVGLDLKFMAGPAVGASSNGTTTSASGSFDAFVFAPALFVGYTAF